MDLEGKTCHEQTALHPSDCTRQSELFRRAAELVRPEGNGGGSQGCNHQRRHCIGNG